MKLRRLFVIRELYHEAHHKHVTELFKGCKISAPTLTDLNRWKYTFRKFTEEPLFTNGLIMVLNKNKVNKSENK